MCLCVIRSGDGTARLWPFNDSGVGTPVVLQHQFKDIENHKNATKDVTSLEWNVSQQKLQLLPKTPTLAELHVYGGYFFLLGALLSPDYINLVITILIINHYM